MQPSEDSLAVTFITRWKLPIVHTWLDFQQILNHEDKICHMTWTLHVTFHYICIIIVVSYFLYSKYVHYYVIDRNIQNVIFILHKSNYYFECYWTWNNVCITSTISGKEQERIVPGESYSPSNLLLTAKYWVDCWLCSENDQDCGHWRQRRGGVSGVHGDDLRPDGGQVVFQTF